MNILRNNFYKTTRYLSTLNETIITRQDYPITKCREILENKTIGVLGYGPQGRGQALNLRDNGFSVSLGLRRGPSYDKALNDDWMPGENLFSVEDCVESSDIVKNLLSDAGQISVWPQIYPLLNSEKTLYFSHGFGVVYNQLTNIVPPDMDVILVAPKGSGLTVRNKFLEGRGINSSYAIHNNYSGQAEETCKALAFGIGSGYLFGTTFEKEVYSDLVGERCVLMGMIHGAFNAQYNVLRRRGHSPTEAYNETVEEALESLFPLVSDKGMDWMFSNCSTTAQRGALDWSKKFEEVLEPVIDSCYENVKNGGEAKRVISSNSDSNYKEVLDKELQEINESELWKTAKEMRKLRV
jgi:ketol-acid reductoisomerase